MEEKSKPELAIKYDWYQTETNVVMTIMVKNVDKDNVVIKFSAETISVNLSLPNGETHTRAIQVAHNMKPDECSYRITPAMIEVKLKKAEGIRWESLERPEDADIVAGPPSYPTSKPGKDWSAIERQIKEQEAKEKPVGEEALNKLFQDIYGKGDDNVKRAMNKSYMESGGTVLSTNWNEIGKDRVEIKPPDGMEWKKWDS